MPTSPGAAGDIKRVDGRTAQRLVLPWWTSEEGAARGAGAFGRFSPKATGSSLVNAYLLAYLSTAAYANYGLKPILRLSNAQEEQLKRDNDRFKDAFERAVRPLFINTDAPSDGPPRISFVHFNDRQGYDPEALVIGTASAVYVVFRGTDAVAGAQGTAGGEEFAEWLKGGFYFQRIAPGDGLRGTVHAGFWNSLSAIKRQLADTVAQFGGTAKPVWITGHSLGGAQSLLFGAYLQKQRPDIKLQGIYAYAAPHVGDEAFKAELIGMGSRTQIQRHEFADDPATAFPPSALVGLGPLQVGYSPIGVRVYYDDIETRRFDEPDRGPLEIGGLVSSAFGLPAGMLENAFTKNAPLVAKVTRSNFCFHHPEWYVQSAYRALRKADADLMPAPLAIPTPTRSTACTSESVARGRESPWRTAEEVVENVTEAAEAVSYTVGSMFANVMGEPVTPNTYTIRPLGAMNKGLARPSATSNGSRVSLATAANAATQRWEVIKVNGGYTIRSGGKFLDVAAEELLANGGKIIMWDANLPFNGHGLNQVWHFYKVSGSNRYLLRNVGSGKVLEASNAAERNTVRQWSGRNSSRAQVWVLEVAR